jgi:hypothetical protein
MDELLGFVVLTGPLLPILVWLAASVLLAIFTVKPAGSIIRRTFIKLLAFLLIVLLPFTDEMVGRVYFDYLCETDAGFKVYEAVVLPEKYWDEDGNLKIFNEEGYLDREFWIDRIDESGGRLERYSSIFNIEKDISTVVYKNDHVLLGDITTFRFWGGWIRQMFSSNNVADSCQFINNPKFSREFYGSFFKPASIINIGR